MLTSCEQQTWESGGPSCSPLCRVGGQRHQHRVAVTLHLGSGTIPNLKGLRAGGKRGGGHGDPCLGAQSPQFRGAVTPVWGCSDPSLGVPRPQAGGAPPQPHSGAQ